MGAFAAIKRGGGIVGVEVWRVLLFLLLLFPWEASYAQVRRDDLDLDGGRIRGSQQKKQENDEFPGLWD